jgi:putative protease
MKKQELLAPAGDIEAGYAALYYGADAVYLGLSKFSARATAVNFDEPTLDEFTAYAHSLKRKVYVALNTVLQESELPELLNSLDICTRCNVDGLIIQDLGVARVMREKYPWFEMHASTQMAVHNKEGALFLKKMGFKRVVLARELTKAEIAEISAIPDLETEVFIHGALCYSYSGLCQFSSLEYGRSANRGKCLYPCRACFKTEDGKERHLFSMKDMALRDDVLQLNADSLKIEGRKKSALYVAAVTDYYRRILDGKGADINLEENIKQIFSRPWCKFHFNGKDKNVIDREFVGHRGLLIGEVESVSHGNLRFKTNHKIARHDGLQIDASGDEKPFGFSLQKLKVAKKSVFEAPKNTVVEIELPPKYPNLSKGDKIYLASSSEVKGAYSYKKPKSGAYKNTVPIDVKVVVSGDKIAAESKGFKAEVDGIFTPAENPQKSFEAVQKAFNKTGDTKFALKFFEFENPNGLFVPASTANELRRRLYDNIKIEKPKISLPEIKLRKKDDKSPQFIIKVDKLECLNLSDLSKFKEIVWLINPDDNISGLQNLPKNKIRIALPAVCRHPKIYEKIINKLLDGGYHKWQVANYWGLEILPYKKLDISFDSTIYMLNTQAISAAMEIGADKIALSLEDIKSNVFELIEKSPLKTELIIYQDIPLFTSVGCIRDNDCKNCKQTEKWFELERNNTKFSALSRNCQMMIFDKRPYCIAAEAKNLQPDFMRMDFCYKKYTAQQVKNIVDKLLDYNDITDCIKGNFNANNI